MPSFFDVFKKPFSSNGEADNWTDNQWILGWKTIGARIPTGKEFNQANKIVTEQTKYLFENLDEAAKDNGETTSANDIKTLSRLIANAGKRPMATVSSGVNTPITTLSGNGVKIPFKNIWNNDGGMFNANTSQFVAPVNGWYQSSGYTTFNVKSASIQIPTVVKCFTYVNNKQYLPDANVGQPMVFNTQIVLGYSVPLHANAGDVIEIRGWASQPNCEVWLQSLTSFLLIKKD